MRFLPDGGFIVESFSGDDFRVCRDHVAERLGLPAFQPGARPIKKPVIRPRPEADEDADKRIGWALAIWRRAVPIANTLAEDYLRSRGLKDLVGLEHVLRFHPQLNYGDAKAPAMVALFRNILTNEVCAVHRTFLTAEGIKIERKMLGPAAGTAIKLDSDEEVTTGLHLGEGIETVLAARQLGYRPAWALGSAGAIRDFPVLPGVEALTVLAENGKASTEAAETVSERYEAAGFEAWAVEPPAGDMNDILTGAT